MHDVAPGILSPLEWGETLSGAPLSSGRLAASKPILVRRWRGVSPRIEQPPLDHHYATLHLGGGKRIRRRGEGGIADHVIADRAYSFTPAGSAFSWSTVGPIDFAHVYLPPSVLQDMAALEFDRDPRAVSLQDGLGLDDGLTAAVLSELASGVAAGASGDRLYWDGLLHTLVFRLLTAHSDLSLVRARAPQALSPVRVRRVAEHVDAHLSETLSLADLASTAGVSPYHFSRAFRRATGVSPYRFVVQRRLERAKALLSGDGLSIAAVGLSCGFTSAAHFSTTFRKAVGVNPARWRALR